MKKFGLHRLMLPCTLLGIITVPSGWPASSEAFAQPSGSTDNHSPENNAASLPSPSGSPATEVLATEAGTTDSQAVSADPDELAEARISLQLRDAPLLQVAKLLELSTPAHFRWATPPDVVISPDVKDSSLLPALESLLGSSRWKMERDGADIFLSARTPAWALWNGSAAPPHSWMSPVSTVKVPLHSQIGNVVTAPQVSQWLSPASPIEAQQRPGVCVELPPALRVTGGTQLFYLRWNLPLRFVPAGARLLIETPAPATLYVNGAPVLRNLKGLRLIDLSRSLQRGDNVLALSLAKPQENLTPVPAPADPLFRYEWFFSSEPGGAASVQNDDEGG